MRKIISGAVMAVTALLLVALTVPSAHAVQRGIQGLEITEVGYNAVGVDHFRNRNQEYVDIKNVSNEPVNVAGLEVYDQWYATTGKNRENNKCNVFTLAADADVPGLVKGENTIELPAKHTLRVYVGAGQPKTFGPGGRWHAVYMNHGATEETKGCGYRGHFFNNLGDTVYVKLGGAIEFKRYDFRRGYYVR